MKRFNAQYLGDKTMRCRIGMAIQKEQRFECDQYRELQYASLYRWFEVNKVESSGRQWESRLPKVK